MLPVIKVRFELAKDAILVNIGSSGVQGATGGSGYAKGTIKPPWGKGRPRNFQ